MRPFRRRLAFQNLEYRRLLAAVGIPDDLSGAAGQVVVAPVNVDTASGIRGAEIRLSYDTELLDLDVADVTAGTVWSGAPDTQVTANVDEASGTVVVFIASSSPLDEIAGSLVNLRFTIQGSAATGATAVLDLTEVTLNEGQITTTPAPVSGADATDGLITVTTATGSQRIGGFVYADANNNSVVDAAEAIPAVRISIVNQAGDVSRQTTTAADGSYEFLDLPNGTYTVTQQQPAAYLDGGNNTLTVEVGTGTSVGNQDFRELGLRPAYVYNRLLSTTVRPLASQRWTDVIMRINVDANSASLASQAALPPQAALPSQAALASVSRSLAALQPTVASVGEGTPRDLLATEKLATEKLDRVFAQGSLF